MAILRGFSWWFMELSEIGGNPQSSSIFVWDFIKKNTIQCSLGVAHGFVFQVAIIDIDVHHGNGTEAIVPQHRKLGGFSTGGSPPWVGGCFHFFFNGSVMNSNDWMQHGSPKDLEVTPPDVLKRALLIDRGENHLQCREYNESNQPTKEPGTSRSNSLKHQDTSNQFNQEMRPFT